METVPYLYMLCPRFVMAELKFGIVYTTHGTQLIIVYAIMSGSNINYPSCQRRDDN